MTAQGAALYTPEILALAVDLARFPLDESSTGRGEARSRVCGSRIILSMATDEQGRVAAIGARVSACAIGQAAAALFLRSAEGRNADEIAASLDELEVWLAGGDGAPSWPGLAALASARSYPARHAAILLAWKAALDALPKHAAAD